MSETESAQAAEEQRKRKNPAEHRALSQDHEMRMKSSAENEDQELGG